MTLKAGKIKSVAVRGGWFRMYADILNDPKVQLLPDRMFKFWVNCLALTSEKRGHLPDAREIAFRLHLNLTEVEDDLASLMTHGLLDTLNVEGRTKLQPHNWFDWQPPSYHSTERVQKWRRNGRETGVKRNVTVPETNETYSKSQSVSSVATSKSIQGKNSTSNARTSAHVHANDVEVRS